MLQPNFGVIIPVAKQCHSKLNTSSSMNSISLVFRKVNGADVR